MCRNSDTALIALVMTDTTARSHTEECRKRLESCLAEDEETKLRSEVAKLRVDNWLDSRVESTETEEC